MYGWPLVIGFLPLDLWTMCMCVSPQNSCVEFLTPFGMVLGGGGFEKW